MTAHRHELSMTDEERTQLLAIVGQCICDAAYRDRGLAQHDCAWCDHGDAVLGLLRKLAGVREGRQSVKRKDVERRLAHAQAALGDPPPKTLRADMAWLCAQLRATEAVVEAARAARDWMSDDGCDCGTDEPGTCALCVLEARLCALDALDAGDRRPSEIPSGARPQANVPPKDVAPKPMPREAKNG